MAWRRIGIGLLIVVLVLAAVAVLWGRQIWHEILQNNGIKQLDWQELELSLAGISVDQLSLTQVQPGREITVQVGELALAWRWQGLAPKIITLTARQVDLDWQTTAEQVPAAQGQAPPANVSLASLLPPSLPGWLPQTLDIQNFQAILPCASGRCPLQGALSVTTANAQLPATAKLQLQHEDHHLGVLAKLDGSWPDAVSATAELTLDDRPYMTAETDYTLNREAGQLSWRGAAEVPALPQAGWLLEWLQAWQSVPLEVWPAQPTTGSVNAQWQLQGPSEEGFFDRVSGTVAVDARVPQPWPAPGVGTVTGNVKVSLQVEQGNWTPDTLQADVKLTKPAGWALRLPEHLRPQALSLSVRPAKTLANPRSDQPMFPLQLELTSEGGAKVNVSSHFAVATSAPWMVQVGKTHVGGNMPKLAVADWSLRNSKVHIALTGWADARVAELSIGKPTSVGIGQVRGPAATEVQLDSVKAELAGTKLVARYSTEQRTLDHLSVKGPVALTASNIRHSQVQSHPWQFRGDVQGDLSSLKLTGLLKAAATPVNINLAYAYQGGLQLAGNMRISGQQEVDALADILTNWPPLLAVAGGNVSTTVTYRRPAGRAQTVTAKLVLADASGTYDRTAWTRMNGVVAVDVSADWLAISVPEITVDEVNPGIPFGPVVIAGHYKASLGQLTTGQLTLEHATSDALGGRVEIKPGSWDLAEVPITVPVEISKLSVAQLLRVYPAEGLAGTGILSGTVPLLIDPASGIQVERGRIDALKPGGRLQLSSERLRALASGNETMRLVAQAMEDFRYSVMGSGINYDKDGNLVLNLHLEGNNPGLQDGHPVVLNINLEENIPALMTSLQLSGKVSDAVAERVKKMLKKRGRKPVDLIE